jgi:hypothetical protein
MNDNMEEDFIPLFEYVNHKMHEETDLAHLLPMDPKVVSFCARLIVAQSISSCMKALKDGVVLCKLVNQEVPGLIDTRVVISNPQTPEDITSNINLLLNAAALLGCDVSSINANDFLSEQVCLLAT